jgi:hypothetical protein
MKFLSYSIDDRRTTHQTSRHSIEHTPRRRRAGFTLMEVTIAFIIIGAAMMTLTQTIWLTRQQMRLVDRQFVATQELANVMERLALVPFDQLTNDRLPNFEPSPELLRVAKQAKIVVEVSEVAGPPAGKRLRAKVSWPTLAREGEVPEGSPSSQETFELVTFRYSPGGSP